MRRRWLPLMLCITFLGVTLTPAAYLPCCCKKKVSFDTRTASKACCSSPRHSANPAPQSGMMKSCCAAKMAAKKTCGMCEAANQGKLCTYKVIKSCCPHCQCLPQMQMVGIAGSGLDENLLRGTADLPMLLPVSNPVDPAPASVDRSLSPPPRILGVTLQTCTLRC
jgi:hypothetical protein